MKILKNNSGTTLIELVASIPLGIIVFLILTIVLINFMTSYNDTRLFIQLQEELFDSIEIIRHGFEYERLTGSSDDPPGQKKDIIGLLTAKEAVIGTAGRYLEVYPINLQGAGWVSKAKFYISDNGELKIDLTYPLGHASGERIFPLGEGKNKKIGNELQFRVVNSNIFSLVKGTPEKPEMIGIHLIGQVRFREKSKKQSQEEDLRLNTKQIDYYTEVFVGNI